MDRADQKRDPDKERLERASYVVLQHICTLADETQEELSARRITADLGLGDQEALAVLRRLSDAHMIQWDGMDDVSCRWEGREYLERRAGRRHSVRTVASEA